MVLGSTDFFDLPIPALTMLYRTGACLFSSATTGFQEKLVTAIGEVLRSTDDPYFIEQSWCTSFITTLSICLSVLLRKGLQRSMARAVYGDLLYRVDITSLLYFLFTRKCFVLPCDEVTET